MCITVNRRVEECEKTGCFFYIYRYETPDGVHFPTPDQAFHHLDKLGSISEWSKRGVFEGSVILHRNTDEKYGRVLRILADSKSIEILLEKPVDGFNKHFMMTEEFDFYYRVNRNLLMEGLGVRLDD